MSTNPLLAVVCCLPLYSLQLSTAELFLVFLHCLEACTLETKFFFLLFRTLLQCMPFLNFWRFFSQVFFSYFEFVHACFRLLFSPHPASVKLVMKTPAVKTMRQTNLPKRRHKIVFEFCFHLCKNRNMPEPAGFIRFVRWFP